MGTPFLFFGVIVDVRANWRPVAVRAGRVK